MASNNSGKSYFSVVISISLVLFMLGITGLLVLKAKSISNSVKENIGITVYLRDDAVSYTHLTLPTTPYV